jgi:hypothetical protein
MLFDKPMIDPLAPLRMLCHVMPGLWKTEEFGFYPQ